MIGVLRLGMIESLFDVCFERLILRYTEHFPKVKVDLTLEATPKLLELVKKGQLDVACLIGGPLTGKDFRTCYEKEVEVAVVAGQKNRLIHEKGLRLRSLCHEKFILMEDEAPYNVRFYHALNSQDIDIQLFLTLQSARMARHIVEDSGYLSFLPLYVVRKSIERGKIVPLHLQDYSQGQFIQLVLHSGKILTPQIQGFLEDTTAVLEDTL